MKRSLFLAIVALLCTGCASSYRDSTLYCSSGSAKPIVAVLPVIVSTENKADWSYSEELTEKICKRICDSSKLYLLKEKGDSEVAMMLNVADPSVISSSAAKNLGAAEFAIVSELIDQHETSYGLPQAADGKPYLNEIGAELHLAMRVRVVDLRKDQPKVILQEVITQNHDIARPYLNVNYRKAHWGEESFERTPMGLAHSKIIRELVAHAEGYIGASKG